MPAVKRSRKSAEERKAEIVEVAIRLAGEHGPDRVTTQMIADQIGITQPGIFRHFPAKTDIWLAVGEWIASAPNEGAARLADTADPGARIRAMIAGYFAGIARHPAIPAILFSHELHAENHALKAHFQRVMAYRRKGFAQLIQLAQDAGQVSNAVAADDVAALILSLIQGLAMRWSLESRAFDLEAEGTRLLDQMLKM